MKDGRYQIGEVGVDSGQIMICDPCYISPKEWDEDFDDDKVREYQEKKHAEFNYSGCCAVTLEEDGPGGGQLFYPLGHAGNGVACRSGVGDGCYPVYVTLKTLPGWGQRVVKVEVDFMEHCILEENKDKLDRMCNGTLTTPDPPKELTPAQKEATEKVLQEVGDYVQRLLAPTPENVVAVKTTVAQAHIDRILQQIKEWGQDVEEWRARFQITPEGDLLFHPPIPLNYVDCTISLPHTSEDQDKEVDEEQEDE